MHDFASRILLVESTREEHRAIKTAIESAEMVDILILHLYLSQNFIPTLTSLLLELIHVCLSQFLEIQHGLGTADKRRSNTCLNFFATLTGFESDDGTHMVSLLLAGRNQFSILHTDKCIKVVIELDDKVIAEIIWYSPAVAGRKTDYFTFRRNHLDITSLVKGINHHIGLISLREGESHQGSTLRRAQLCRYIIVCQIDTIIIRCSLLCLVREPAGTLRLIKDRLTHGRQERELTIIIDPRTWLMSLLQSFDLLSRISVLPSIAHISGLRHPEVHTPWHCYGWISITC